MSYPTVLIVGSLAEYKAYQRMYDGYCYDVRSGGGQLEGLRVDAVHFTPLAGGATGHLADKTWEIVDHIARRSGALVSRVPSENTA